eukprot:scaffold2544_cov401-Prasinococcus_capsulatus_cf.AAC.14
MEHFGTELKTPEEDENNIKAPTPVEKKRGGPDETDGSGEATKRRRTRRAAANKPDSRARPEPGSHDQASGSRTEQPSAPESTAHPKGGSAAGASTEGVVAIG